MVKASIGDFEVVLTPDNKVLVFHKGALFRDACRRYHNRGIAYKYFDKITKYLEEKEKLGG